MVALSMASAIAVVGTVLLVNLDRPPRVAIVLPTPQAIQPRSPLPVPSPPIGRSVRLAPIEDFPVADAEALVAHYRAKFDLEIELLPSILIPDDAFDPERRQVIAERLLDAIRAEHSATDPEVVVIGLTSADMYIAGKTWRYAYGLRADGHLAVVSTARMGAGVDDDRRMQRLRKMVTKNIGILYYGLPVSDDPSSVLFKDILGPDDLDRVSEDF